MKRKIALLLAFVMVFSLLPMTVSAQVVGPMPNAPTLPDTRARSGDARNMGLFVVDTPTYNHAYVNFGHSAFPNLGDSHPSIVDTNSYRWLNFSATHYGWGTTTTTSHALVTVSGLGDNGNLIPHESALDQGIITLAQAIINDFPMPDPTGVRRPLADLSVRGSGSDPRTPVANELLFFGEIDDTNRGNNGQFFTVLMFRDGNARNRAILVVVADPTQDAGWVTGDGVSMPVLFYTQNNNNVVFTTNAPSGSRIESRAITMATRHSDDFEFNFDGTPRAFHTRTAIDAIEILEPESLGFNSENWEVELTLDRGFSWHRSHGTGSLSDWGVRVGSDYGTLATGPVFGVPSTSGNTADLSRGRLSNVDRDTSRRMTVGFNLTNWQTTNRLVERIIIGNDYDEDNALQIQADDNARRGPVRVHVNLFRVDSFGYAAGTGTSTVWRRTVTMTNPAGGVVTGFQEIAGGARPDADHDVWNGLQPRNYGGGIAFDHAEISGLGAWISETVPNVGNVIVDGRSSVASGYVTVAYWDTEAIVLYRYEDHDLDDFELMSGRREWDWAAGRNPAAGALTGAWDAVVEDSINEYYHQTATVVLTETVPGTLPFTGLGETIFSFPEGVQVLAVEFNTNDANFYLEDGSTGDVEDDRHYFIDGQGASRSGPLDALVRRNYVSIRPQIEEHNTIARIYATFYISVQAQHEALFGQDIDVHVSFRGGTAPTFEDSETIARAWDPITVSTTPLTIDDDGEAAWGRIRQENLNNIVITETEPGALRRGTTIWLGVEGGLSLAWGSADFVSLSADSVSVNTDDSNLTVSSPVRDQRGTFVTIERESIDEPAVITFSGVAISGALIPGTTYSVIVAGEAVADNFGVSAFAWEGPLFGGGTFTRIGHGLFTPEPYPTEAFTFEGADLFGTPGVVAPPVIQGAQPRTLFQNQPFTIQFGEQAGMTIFPSFEMVAFGDGSLASAFIAAAAIGDVLGWDNTWDAATSTGTFFLPDGRVVVFTNGSNVVNVNGVQQFMTNADGSPANAYIGSNDRFMVHIRFFEQLGVNITWLGGTAGNNSLIVTP